MAAVPVFGGKTPILVKSGWNTIYMKTASYEKGVNPEQLQRYQAPFAQASKDCSASTKGLVGMQRARAKAQCMQGKLGKAK